MASLAGRRDARAAEWDGLENRLVMSPVGSNPTPSATLARSSRAGEDVRDEVVEQLFGSGGDVGINVG